MMISLTKFLEDNILTRDMAFQLHDRGLIRLRKWRGKYYVYRIVTDHPLIEFLFLDKDYKLKYGKKP